MDVLDSLLDDNGPSDRLALYTDGLGEVRDQDIDSRLRVLRSHLDAAASGALDEICDKPLTGLRGRGATTMSLF